VSPALALLPKWGAIVVVLLVAAVPVGAALGSLPLVQTFSIYHVLSAGMVLLSFGYGTAEVVSQETMGVGISQLVREKVEPPPKAGGMASSAYTMPVAANSAPGPDQGGAAPNTAANPAGPEAATETAGPPPPEPEPADVAWSATADPSHGVQPKINSRLPSIHFGVQPWNPITPAGPSAWLAVGDNRKEESVRQLWDSAENERLGELGGQIEFTEPVTLSADKPVIAGYIHSGRLVEVWSLVEGQMISRVPCQDIVGDAVPRIYFLSPDTLALVYPRANQPAPVCQVWNFTTNEMQGEFVAIGASNDAKTQWALSPGHKYLAAADRSVLRVFGLSEHTMVGKVAIPPLPNATALDCVGIAFHPDGARLSALFRGEKKFRLLAWDMSDGRVLADGEFNIDLSRGAATDGRPLEPLGGNDGWVAYERVIIPPITGKQVRAWSINHASLSAPSTPRVAKVIDSRKLLIIADDSLHVVKVPSPKQRAPNELLTLAQLLSGSSSQSNDKNAAGQRPMPGAGQSAEGVPEQMSREYVRNTYIDFLSADDERVNEMIRWAPWSKRPVLGVRWGLGILPTNVPGPLVEKEQIEPVTGAAGPKLVAELDSSLEQGDFGAWPPGKDSRLTRVGWLGIGNRNQLLASAKRQEFDIVAVVNVNWQKGDARQISVRVADVVNSIVIYNSSTLKVGPPGSNLAAKAEAVDKWVAEVMRQVDQKMTLQPFPEMTAKEALQTMEKRMEAKRRNVIADLVELRAYQARHLIDESTAAGYYEALMGEGRGAAFAHDDVDARRKILKELLPAEDSSGKN
ncbi:MAG TPA: hypothetical protein VMF30_05480, partial [Pirellulales bacterium]|nr:hypothetical protein [Pirellulales bacterium]